MSTNKCFENLDTTIVNGSDRTNALRQKTIYRELQHNCNTVGPDPQKQNGFQYNQNFKTKEITSPLNDKVKYELASAKNHELLLDITKGKRFANPIPNVGHNRYKMWGGNIMNVSYEQKVPMLPVKYATSTDLTTITEVPGANIIYIPYNAESSFKNTQCNTECNTNGENSDNKNYYIIDPYHNVFNTPCYFSTPAHIPPWIKTTVSKIPAFKKSYYYLQGAHADPLVGITYPGKVNLEHQQPCIETHTACLDECKK